MKKLWITYAWKDNEDKDVDWLAGELANMEIDVKIDKWHIPAGGSLWAQIDEAIASDCDAWLFYGTENSLASMPCMEEFGLARQRALDKRGKFPIITLFPSPVDKELIPPGMGMRLHVSLTDPHWKERISAAVFQRDLNIPRENLENFVVKIHNKTGMPYNYVVEVRPRAGSWNPCFMGVLNDEVGRTMCIVSVLAKLGGRDCIPSTQLVSGVDIRDLTDIPFTVCTVEGESNSRTSLFGFFRELPSVIIFGAAREGEPIYEYYLRKR